METYQVRGDGYSNQAADPTVYYDYGSKEGTGSSPSLCKEERRC